MKDYIPVLIVVVATVGLCVLVDFLYKKLFRSEKQHASGLSVRLNSKLGAFGLILGILGIAAIFMSIRQTMWIFGAAGGLLLLVGIAMIVYYMSFGIYYDADSFIFNMFGKSSKTYRFDQIVGQKLYTVGGSVMIELHMDDDSTIGLQSTMSGVYPFLDIACAGWLRQKDLTTEDCPYYDPSNSCWFPEVD